MLSNEWILNNKISGIKLVFSLYATIYRFVQSSQLQLAFFNPVQRFRVTSRRKTTRSSCHTRSTVASAKSSSWYILGNYDVNLSLPYALTSITVRLCHINLTVKPTRRDTYGDSMCNTRHVILRLQFTSNNRIIGDETDTDNFGTLHFRNQTLLNFSDRTTRVRRTFQFSRQHKINKPTYWTTCIRH